MEATPDGRTGYDLATDLARSQLEALRRAITEAQAPTYTIPAPPESPFGTSAMPPNVVEEAPEPSPAPPFVQPSPLAEFGPPGPPTPPPEPTAGPTPEHLTFPSLTAPEPPPIIPEERVPAAPAPPAPPGIPESPPAPEAPTPPESRLPRPAPPQESLWVRGDGVDRDTVSAPLAGVYDVDNERHRSEIRNSYGYENLDKTIVDRLRSYVDQDSRYKQEMIRVLDMMVNQMTAHTRQLEHIDAKLIKSKAIGD